ncbi:MAG: SDR family NAD(P)-dependent oxidoreductase [Pseudomonadota bacterium]
MSVVITGANRGIGAGLYDIYAARGPVIGTSRRGDTPFAALDVTDASSLNAFKETLGDTPVELLICNAGVYFDKGHGLSTGYDADLWAKTFATNVTGVFLTVQSLLPNLKVAQTPKIAIISSIMASSSRAPGGSYIYRSSKAAVLNLGRNMAQDLKADNIAVGIYHPGWVQTDMGGAEADIDTNTSVKGLVERFDALSLATTGVFEGYDGTQMLY